MSDTTPCYVAKKACGHYVYAAVVMPEPVFMASVYKELAKMAEQGATVELKDVQFARENLFRCTCAAPRKAPAQTQEER
jgi:hypothetical protein